jgi:hypothetical protein
MYNIFVSLITLFIKEMTNSLHRGTDFVIRAQYHILLTVIS